MSASGWFRGSPGERGKLGDHGQDGRQGIQGERGPAGYTDADRDVDEEIREALALALSEKTRRKDEEVDNRLRSVDKRLLTAYLVMAFTFILVVFVEERSDDRFEARAERFQDQVIGLCEQDAEARVAFNATLEQFAKLAGTNPARSPEERKRAAESLLALKRPIPDCPPRD